MILPHYNMSTWINDFWEETIYAQAKLTTSFSTHFSDTGMIHLSAVFLMPSWVNTLRSTFQSEICLRFSSRPREKEWAAQQKSYPRLSFLLDAGDWLWTGKTFPIAVSAPSSSFLIMPCRQRRRDCYLARLSIALLSAAEPRGSVDQSWRRSVPNGVLLIWKGHSWRNQIFECRWICH